MITLGFYGDERDGAAAVAVKGRLVAAVHATSGDNDSSRPPVQAAVERALRVANVSASDVDATIRVSDTDRSSEPAASDGRFCFVPSSGTFTTATATSVRRQIAEAAQLRTRVQGDAAVLVLEDSGTGEGSIVRLEHDRRETLVALEGAKDLMQTIAMVAKAVGADPERPIVSLDLLANTCDGDEALFAQAVRSEGAAFYVDHEAIARTIQHVQADCPANLAGNSVHVRVERGRRGLAAGIMERAATVVAEVSTYATDRWCAGNAGFAGDAFATLGFADRVLSRVPNALFAPVSDRLGSAIGASLLPQVEPEPLDHLALGSKYDDAEIKEVLDNCRLEYVYEPDWSRLHRRVSELLRTGALVGWFQGPADFGRQSFGSRSVLCDPSSRYSRENVNVFLLHRNVKQTLPVSLAPSVARDYGLELDALRFTRQRVAGHADMSTHLSSALEPTGDIVAHVPHTHSHQELVHLLEVHHSTTEVPGLINVPLMANGALAATPRDVVRAMFGSAIDVLVMGRFLVSKDYWMIRRR